MRRRELCKSIVTLSTSLVVCKTNSKEQSDSGGIKISSPQNVLFFGSSHNASEMFLRAIRYLNTHGGGDLYVPSGEYSFDDTVYITINTRITIITASNSLFIKKTDSDLFSIEATITGSMRILGHGEFIYNGPKTNKAACVRFKNQTKGRGIASSSFEINGRMRIRKGRYEWKYGLYLENTRDTIIQGIQIDGLSSELHRSKQIGIYSVSNDSPSVSWTICNVQLNDLYIGFYFECNHIPGIEGLKIINCDIVGVATGISYVNNTKYFPPQIEIIGCHINGYDDLISINKSLSIHIVSCLLYRSGSKGGFIRFTGVQDVTINSVSFAIIDVKTDVPGIVLDGRLSTSAFVRVDNCHYWAYHKKSPFISLLGDIKTISLGLSTKDSYGKWIDTVNLSSPKSNVSIDTETIALTKHDYGDLIGCDLECKEGVLNLSDVVIGPTFISSDVPIKKLVSGKINKRYILIMKDKANFSDDINILNIEEFPKGKSIIEIVCVGDDYYCI
ncbi:TPA: hypothetical protein ACMEVV_004808 [Klebsiella quasipneumoniae subsp. quasipneumoniae]